jgi:undecaprenyl-diphosphatase
VTAPTLRRTILASDARLSVRLRDLAARSAWLRRAAIPLARSGDAWLWLTAAGVLAAIGGASARRQAVRVAIALIATGLAVRVAKRLTRRERPVGEWGGSYRRRDPHAFPSGHSARAALLAVLGFALGPSWLGMLLATWAPLVALSRVALGVHYLSDVIVGVLVGFGCGLAALALAGC